jgi:deoxyribodipyrimidine photo-lyase
MSAATLVWFRLDLRLADNPALLAAMARGGPILPVFVWSPEEEGAWPPGAASRWWLHHSLTALDRSLRERGSRLILRRGPALAALRTLAMETGANTVFWNRRYEPALLARDAQVKKALEADGLAVASFNSALLFEPSALKTLAGKPFQVFTPFWRACLAMPTPATPVKTPRKLGRPARWPATDPLSSFDFLPKPNWATGLLAAWQPGEAGAIRQLRFFLEAALSEYPRRRDIPAHQERRGSPRTCTSERLARARYGTRLARPAPNPAQEERAARRRKPICANSVGANLLAISSFTFRTPTASHCAASSPASNGAATAPRSRLGSAVAQAIR